MRISDWSSDVCSSDLRIRCLLPAALREWTDGGQGARHGVLRERRAQLHPGQAPALPANQEAQRLKDQRRAPLREPRPRQAFPRSEEHTSELQSLMRNSSAVICLKNKKKNPINKQPNRYNNRTA